MQPPPSQPEPTATGEAQPSVCAFRPVVVVPTYNNGATLSRVLSGIDRFGYDVIVVDDGSTDKTVQELDRWRSSAGERLRHVVSHGRNRGKAEALQTGFGEARLLGYSHAVTIDSDDQHDPADLPGVVGLSRVNPASLVLGVRDVTARDYPRRSRLGRKLSNVAVKLACGQRVTDSQCGLRAYPLGLTTVVRGSMGRYAYETEFITRAVWAGAGVVETAVACRYTIEGGRVSHFKPMRDTLHGLLLHARLLGRAMLPVAHAHRWRDPNGRAARTRSVGPLWRRALAWLNPLTALRGIRAGQLAREELAAAVGVGVLIGNLPIIGGRTAACLYTAARLHLNPHLVVASSAVCGPPLGIFLAALAVGIGHWVLHGTYLSVSELEARSTDWLTLLRQLFIEWAVGGVVVGVSLAVVSALVTYLLMSVLHVARTADTATPEPAQRRKARAYTD